MNGLLILVVHSICSQIRDWFMYYEDRHVGQVLLGQGSTLIGISNTISSASQSQTRGC